MLQRIQTVYFALAIVLISLPLFGMELFSFHLDKGMVSVNAYQFVFPNGEQLLKNDIWILNAIQIIFAIWIIFSFKFRSRQVFIGWILLLLNMLTTAWVYLSAYVKSNSCLDCKVKADLHFDNIFFISALAFIFIFMGIRGVKKDKKLIDSLDRLR